MQIEKYKIEEHNQSLLKEHQRKFDFIAGDIKIPKAFCKNWLISR